MAQTIKLTSPNLSARTGFATSSIQSISQYWSIRITLNFMYIMFLCMLHTKKLKVFETAVQNVSAHSSFSGPIVSERQHCEVHKSIGNFEDITCNQDLPKLSKDVLVDLSCEERFLHIKTGRKPGRVNRARRLTLANRVCRLYVSSENPSIHHNITQFIATNYGLNWFEIKRDSLCIAASGISM